MKTFASDGSRVPFDPAKLGSSLGGCLLCGAPVVVVGVFVPHTSEMRAAVLCLREHRLIPGVVPTIAYGLCRHHALDERAPVRVETAILTAAARVVFQ